MLDDFLRTRALELLANYHAKIKEVATALGFSNPANFGKASNLEATVVLMKKAT